MRKRFLLSIVYQNLEPHPEHRSANQSLPSVSGRLVRDREQRHSLLRILIDMSNRYTYIHLRGPRIVKQIQEQAFRVYSPNLAVYSCYSAQSTAHSHTAQEVPNMAPNKPVRVHSKDGIQMPMFSQAMIYNGLVGTLHTWLPATWADS